MMGMNIPDIDRFIAISLLIFRISGRVLLKIIQETSNFRLPVMHTIKKAGAPASAFGYYSVNRD
jgi:hypothetical protein